MIRLLQVSAFVLLLAIGQAAAQNAGEKEDGGRDLQQTNHQGSPSEAAAGLSGSG